MVWNNTLAVQKSRLDGGLRPLSFAEACRRLTGLKAELPFLKEAPAHALQQPLRHQDAAIREGLSASSEKGFPKFKKKGRCRDSITFPDGFKIDEANSRVCLPKIGWVRYRNSRMLGGEARSITVFEKNGRWHMSVSVKTLKDLPDLRGGYLGIDRNARNRYADSDGHIEPRITEGRDVQDKRRRHQQELARKEPGSKNWHKAKAKLDRFEEKVANRRLDTIHKSTRAISDTQAVVALEKLDLKGLTASNRGTGADVAKKAAMNRAMLEQSHYEFARQLEYKLAEKGGTVVYADPAGTSSTCSACGAEGLRTSPGVFRCPGCGAKMHADVNAAINIAAKGLPLIECALTAAGHAAAACGEFLDSAALYVAEKASSANQEPAEGVAA
jgi:putative transposase